MGDASLPVCRPDLRLAGWESGDAGGRGAVSVCPSTPGPPSPKCESHLCLDVAIAQGVLQTRSLDAVPPPRVHISRNSEDGPAGTSQAVSSGPSVSVVAGSSVRW